MGPSGMHHGHNKQVTYGGTTTYNGDMQHYPAQSSVDHGYESAGFHSDYDDPERCKCIHSLQCHTYVQWP